MKLTTILFDIDKKDGLMGFKSSRFVRFFARSFAFAIPALFATITAMVSAQSAASVPVPDVRLPQDFS